MTSAFAVPTILSAPLVPDIRFACAGPALFEPGDLAADHQVESNMPRRTDGISRTVGRQ